MTLNPPGSSTVLHSVKASGLYTFPSSNHSNSDKGEGLILHPASGLASPALQTGSLGTHIPWCFTPSISVPLIFPLGVTPDPQPGSRFGAASRWPRPSSLPLFLGRRMAPAHVPAPPAPESGGRAELRLLKGGEARSPAAPPLSHSCTPLVLVRGGLQARSACP